MVQVSLFPKCTYSLYPQVYPFAGLIEMTNPFCPRLLINKEPVRVTENGGADGGFLFFEVRVLGIVHLK